MRNYAAAAQEFSRLLEGTPGDDKLRYMLAHTLEHKGDHDAAFQNYLRISPSFELYANAQIQAAMILKKLGRMDEAIARYRRWRKKRPARTLSVFIITV